MSTPERRPVPHTAPGTRTREGRTPSVPGPVATSTLVLAGGLGLAADSLLWAGPVGPGLAAWVLLLAAAAVMLGGRSVVPWAVVAVAAAAGTAWRSAPPLRLLFLGMLVLAASMVVLDACGRRFARTRVVDHLYGLARVPWLAGTGAFPLLLAAELPERAARQRRALALGRGVLLALPPLAVFLALFTAADPVFERTIHRLTTFGAEDLPIHAALVLGYGWIAAGLLRGVLPGPRGNPLRGLRPPRIGIEETAVVLGLVATLFTAFVALQLGYLFGGRATIEAVTGLTLAEYARRGFFELVTAAGLVLALLLGVGAAAPRGTGRWVFRALAGLLVGLVLVVIASAALRLRLYIDEFGLTTTRLYAAAFMAWLGATLAWYGATVIRGRPRPFASGAMVLAIVGVFGLGALDPDALIARTNVELADRRPVDAAYLATLSPDAVPVVLANLDAFTPAQRCSVAEAMRRRRVDQLGDPDWRIWSLGDARARAAIDRAASELRRMEASCLVPDPEDGAPAALPGRVAPPSS